MAQRSDVAVHGRKRPAEEELDDQPLTKKFGRLQIEQELAETEILDGAFTILPGIEGRLSLANILVANESKRPCTAVVLYREPESLSIPKDKDQVRRALIETRERARLSQQRVQSSPRQQRNDTVYTDQGLTHKEECQQRVNSDDDDAMDIDVDGY
ncbi:hypothetical protein BDW60DRAFT_215543 [Aspergillus nidulans var. acristatus]